MASSEGGWGYVVALSLSLIYSVTTVPLYSFGLVFGDLLKEIDAETYGPSLSNGIYNTVLSFTGLATSHFLQKYSCKIVCLSGAVLFFLGSIGVIWTKNLSQFITCYGILQGIGFGLMMPAALTSFNGHFTSKRNFVMALCQAAVVSVTLAWPATTEALLGALGWRGTQAIFAALSLNCLVAALTFRPGNQSKGCEKESVVLIEPFQERRDNTTKDGDNVPARGLMVRLSRSMDLGLLLDPVYVNTAIGLSMSYTSDFMFISLLPMIVVSRGYTAEQATAVMTVHFTFDLICNLFLPILNRLVRIKNRHLFLGGTIASAVARTLFVMNESFVWMLGCVGALGFLRSFIQTPLPLVIAESYGDRFTTAFSLYMAVCGCVTLIYGPLIGVVNSITVGYAAVVHTLTAAHVLCALPWLVELIIIARVEKS